MGKLCFCKRVYSLSSRVATQGRLNSVRESTIIRLAYGPSKTALALRWLPGFEKPQVQIDSYRPAGWWKRIRCGCLH